MARSRGCRRRFGEAIAAAVVALLAFGPVGFAPVAMAEEDGWSNADGTSTTASGRASTQSPAQVFAFNVGVTVTTCSSPDGQCVVGEPQGPTSFEIFAASPRLTVTFSVTTTTPIACGSGIAFQASFNGTTYDGQPALPSGNDCVEPPPDPCPVSNVGGYFEPVQSVFQDDPLDASAHFVDKPGKQLVQTAQNAYRAELPMIRGKPTLLFGIDHHQNGAPKDRAHLVITGTTTGTKLVPVAMLFSGAGAGVNLLHETPTLGAIDLDGPCGPPRDFRISIDATLGQPADPVAPFLFSGTGAYTLTNELRREGGGPTGIKVTVSGTVIETKMPSVAFIPMRATSHVSTTQPAPPNGLQAASDALADLSAKRIPDYFPLRPGGMPVTKATLIDARARVSAEVESWSHWAAAAVGLKSDAELTKQVLIAVLGDSAQLGGTLGKVGRTIVVLTPSDVEAMTGLAPKSGWVGIALSQKVILVRSDQDHFTVAHELVHTLPYIWSGRQMQQKCDIDYHNADIAALLAHGFQVTFAGAVRRESRDGWHALMGRSSTALQWISQCTYWQLTGVLRDPPDPAVVVVRGRLARNGSAVAGEFLPAYQVADGVVDLAAGAGGDWAIVARDAAGAVLGNYPFDPGWYLEDADLDRNVVGFGYRIPSLAGLARLELAGPGGLLDTLTLSAHAPSLTISAPKTNTAVKPASGMVKVTWAGRDADGDALTYTVLYSSNSGKTYTPQAVEQTASSFAVAVGSGTVHWVKIVANDGGRSAEKIVTFSSESPAELVAKIQAGYRAGTGPTTLLSRLDPAVIARYGSTRCRTFLGTVKVPTLAFKVISQTGPSAWNWVSDGRSTRIPAAYTLAVDRTEKGVKSRISIHLSIRSGRLAFFADCGTPL